MEPGLGQLLRRDLHVGRGDGGGRCGLALGLGGVVGLLAVERAGAGGFAQPVGPLAGGLHPGGLGALAGLGGGQLGLGQGHVGAGGVGLQPQQHLAAAHRVALGHGHRFDGAVLRRHHLQQAALHLDLAAGDRHRAGRRGGRGRSGVRGSVAVAGGTAVVAQAAG